MSVTNGSARFSRGKLVQMRSYCGIKFFGFIHNLNLNFIHNLKKLSEKGRVWTHFHRGDLTHLLVTS